MIPFFLADKATLLLLLVLLSLGVISSSAIIQIVAQIGVVVVVQIFVSLGSC